MTRGYVLLYDERGGDGSVRRESYGGNALLQKKSYFQNFSVKRNVFTREPVCANPGQYTLPGGWLNQDIVHDAGTCGASLQQFYEESGISEGRLEQLNFIHQGYYAPKPQNSRRGKSPPFYVHFVQVDDVSLLAKEANLTLAYAADILINCANSMSEKELHIRDLHCRTGLNDDAASCYESVPWTEILNLLIKNIPFDELKRDEWARLVREQGLYFNAERGQEVRITQTITDPGSNRDWLVDGVQAFLSWPTEI